MRVASNERIVRPIDHHAAQLAHGLTLIFLEPPPEPEVASLGANGEHVGPVYDLAAFHAREPVDEAEQRVVLVERASHHAADTLRDLENARGDHVAERFPPRLALKLNTGTKFVARGERANLYRTPVDRERRHHQGLVAALNPITHVPPGAGS